MQKYKLTVVCEAEMMARLASITQVRWYLLLASEMDNSQKKSPDLVITSSTSSVEVFYKLNILFAFLKSCSGAFKIQTIFWSYFTQPSKYLLL